jgi:hypothetical protein
MRTHFFSHDNFEDYSTEQLSLLLDHLREYASYCALLRNYDEGERANDLARRVRNDLTLRSDEPWSMTDTSLPEFEAQLAILDVKYEAEMAGYKEATDERLAALADRQAQDEEEFERHWRVDMPPKYRKPSTRLIELFEIERRLGLQGRFVEAKRAKMETEKLEMEETERAQRLLIREYKIAREQFVMDQKTERQVFEEARAQGEAVIAARQKVERQYFLNRKNVLEQKLAGARIQKENSMRPAVAMAQNAGSAVIYNRESLERTGRLLPQLKAPNDEETKEMIKLEEEAQQERNRRFCEYQQQKAMEADASGSSSSSYSVDYSEEHPMSEAIEPDSEEAVKEEMDTSETESSVSSSEWVDQADQSTQTRTVEAEEVIQLVPRSETFDLTQTEQFRGDVDG